jgi:hypothetical protein
LKLSSKAPVAKAIDYRLAGAARLNMKATAGLRVTATSWHLDSKFTVARGNRSNVKSNTDLKACKFDNNARREKEAKHQTLIEVDESR